MKRSINHYVSVVVEGELIDWTGRNPDMYPEDREEALKIARRWRKEGQSAYAVEVKEIYDPEDPNHIVNRDAADC